MDFVLKKVDFLLGKYVWKYFGKHYLKNFSIMLSGSLGFQLIQFIGMPFMTKFYTPSQMGEFAIFVSYYSIFSVVSRGRFEHALMLPKRKSEVLKVPFLSIKYMR